MKRLLVLLLLLSSSLHAQVSGPSILQIGGDAPSVSVIGAKNAVAPAPEITIPNCILALYPEKYTDPGTLQTSLWVDASPAKNNFTESVDASKPLKNHSGASASTNVCFISPASMSAVTTVLTAPPWTAIIVQQQNTGPNVLNNYLGLPFDTMSDIKNYNIFGFQPSGTTNACYLRTGRSVRIEGATWSPYNPPSSEYLRPHAEIIRTPSTSSYEVRFNNSQIYSGGAYSAQFDSNLSLDPYFSGNYYTIYAAYLFSRSLSNSEISTILTYVNTKYKLGMAL